jgi:hypothetical protein
MEQNVHPNCTIADTPTARNGRIITRKRPNHGPLVAIRLNSVLSHAKISFNFENVVSGSRVRCSATARVFVFTTECSGLCSPFFCVSPGDSLPWLKELGLGDDYLCLMPNWRVPRFLSHTSIRAHNKPWKPIGLWDVEEPKLSRPAITNRRPAAWFTPAPAKSQVYFQKS